MIDLLPVLMTATRTIPQQMTEWFGVPMPDELLAELGIRVGDSLYLAEEYVGTTGCLVLTKTPQASARAGVLVEHQNTTDTEDE